MSINVNELDIVYSLGPLDNGSVGSFIELEHRISTSWRTAKVTNVLKNPVAIAVLAIGSTSRICNDFRAAGRNTDILTKGNGEGEGNEVNSKSIRVEYQNVFS